MLCHMFMCPVDIVIELMKSYLWHSWIKGSTMIVCVLLVSNPRVRQHPREFDTNNTHTIIFDPDHNMMPPIFSQLPLFCSLKTIKSLNREQPQSPLPCYHVILVASVVIAFTPGRENVRAGFCGRLSVWNRTAPDRRHLIPVATTKLIMQWV